MMKKFFISWLLILCLLTASVSFAACGENKEGDLSQPTVDFEDLPDDDEDIEEDETMHWDEDDEDEEGYGPEEEDLSDFSDEEEDERY